MQKKAHFIGIAGMGMSATALLLKEQGWEVSGSDADSYPPGTTQLERCGIPFNTSYAAKNIPKDTDTIVIGMHAKLTRENNQEVQAACESGIRIASFPEVLADIVKERESVVIAGSYGKSTITSIIAWCLSQSGVDAGWFIGGAPLEMEPSHLGTHPVFVVEGDEYPTSREDSRPKFVHYHAHDALVSAASHDHVNIYKTQREFLKPFQVLANSLPADGLLLLCADEPHAVALGKRTQARIVLYGTNPRAPWRAANANSQEMTTFDLLHENTLVAKISTHLIGNHNVQNIVGASAFLLEKKLITPEQLVSALKDFRGLARRLDKKTDVSSIPAHEGFGSSREKLQAAIAAMRVQYPGKRLVVVFEPHTFSWRNKNMLYWFDDAFSGADLVILYKPAEQGAATHEQSSQQEMADRLSQAGIAVKTAATPEETMEIATSEIRDGDVVLMSSSGAMDGLIEQIPQWLDNEFSA